MVVMYPTIGTIVRVVGHPADCHWFAARILGVDVEPIDRIKVEFGVERLTLGVFDGGDQGLLPGCFSFVELLQIWVADLFHFLTY